MDISRELKKNPPRENLTSLESLIRDWLWRESTLNRDTVTSMCREAASLEEAIWLATDSIGQNGKMYPHQVKVRKSSRDALAVTMSRKLRPRRLSGFHDLFLFTRDNAPWGIGELTIYDVALRVGAYLNLEPKRLYLHTGVRAGITSLADAARVRISVKASWLIPPDIPWRFEDYMTWDDTEDFLCTYRNVFGTIADHTLNGKIDHEHGE
jgi:hypothetical protein